MSPSSRRTFLGHLGAAAVVPLIGAGVPRPNEADPSAAAQADAGPYDLLIAGGHVIDAAQHLSARRDVAVAGGVVVKVAEGIARGSARQVVDATGKIVAPGLIDMHGHVFDQFLPVSIEADLVGLPAGVTTIVDAGSAGAFTFPAFRKYVIEHERTRVYALLNISAIGLVVLNELYIDPKLIDPKAAIKTIEDNRPLILGIKVRINGRDNEVDHDVDALGKARIASDATGVPIMMHWTNEPRLLSILKHGDVLTHPFNPPRAGPNCLGPDGKVLPQILELKDRGIRTDFAHGSHLDWTIAEKAAAQGWFPDTISTDIHRAHVKPNGIVIDLVTTMSKFLYLGLPVAQAIEKVTAAPAQSLKFPDRIGTLAAGSVADISILTIEQGSFELADSARQTRTGSQRIVPFATVKGGRLVAPASA
jgi:dihydroorotase